MIEDPIHKELDIQFKTLKEKLFSEYFTVVKVGVNSLDNCVFLKMQE